MLRSKNVATPPTAATGVVPLSVPPPGLAPSATLTLPVNPDTRFPSASTARTFTAGLIWWPATVGLGSVLSPRRRDGPGVTFHQRLVPLLQPVPLPHRQSPVALPSARTGAPLAPPHPPGA